MRKSFVQTKKQCGIQSEITFLKEKVVKLQKSVGYKVKAFIALEFDKKPYILGYIFGGD